MNKKNITRKYHGNIDIHIKSETINTTTLKVIPLKGFLGKGGVQRY